MENFDVLIINTEHFNLHISKKVNDIWQEYRQLKPMDSEACGVLIGDKDFEIERYCLVEITVPQKKDLCTRMSFTSGIPSIRIQLIDYIRILGGTWLTLVHGIRILKISLCFIHRY